MKKVLGQTVRDLKREVNKKVLKVPGIEQKVLDATSNEPWGPHGTHLADIAQATRNFNEYQMIMAVLWKRINDTGKNWRHVYKALTVLEYLVAHGSERVIDEIREHAYQISTLSDFQYIDSGGKDQGSNVRKKSQSLVVLVNDKDRIQEARQKALTNRDKYRGPSSTGGIYKPSPYPSTEGGYGDQHNDDRYESRYGNRDDEQSGYGREREWGSRSDDRYGRDGDTYGRDGDRYSRDSDERYGRDGYKDDDYQSGSRHRSSDREKERPYEDGDPQDERQLERKLSEQQIGAPPSYEEAVTAVRSPGQYERDGGAQAATAPKAASPQNGSPNQDPSISVTGVATASVSKEVDSFDEFDPRSPISAAPPAAISAEMDFFGSISELASPNPLAIMPVNSAPTASAADTFADSSFGTTFVALSSASTMLNQPSENPFGEAPFKATSSQDPFSAQPHNLGPISLPPPSTSEGSQPLQPVALSADPFSDFHFGDSFQGITYPPSAQLPHVNQEFSPQELPSVQSSGDILADILPQSAPAAPLAPEVANFLPQPAGPAAFVPQPANPTILTQPASPAPFAPQSGTSAPFAPQSVSSSPFGPQPGNLVPFAPQPGSLAPFSPQPGSLAPFAPQPGSSAPFAPQPGSSAPFTPQSGSPALFTPQSAGSASFSQQPMGPSSFSPQPVGPAFYASQPTGPIPFASQPVGTTPFAQQSTGPISLSSQPATAAPMGLPAQSQPQKDKFEPKSTVWADTLSRGLVNLNISGAKINPLADIGIDFDSINRKEKLKEKSSVAQATSTITMGKAMGSGSGMGRAGATGLPPPPNPMIGSGMVIGGGANMGLGGGANMGMGMGGGANMGMGGGANMGMGMGMGMGSYGGGMNQQPMGMGMGGMGMGMNMGQGAQFRPATGLPPSGPALPPGYNPNPMMGMGGYGAQQPHGGYR